MPSVNKTVKLTSEWQRLDDGADYNAANDMTIWNTSLTERVSIYRGDSVPAVLDSTTESAPIDPRNEPLYIKGGSYSVVMGRCPGGTADIHLESNP